jgi:hypothetical protein
MLPSSESDRPEKCATPPTAATEVVPLSVPDDAVSVTRSVPLTGLPLTSSMVTSALKEVRTSTVVGCIVNATCVAAPAEMVKLGLTAPARPVAVAESV